MSVLFEKAVVNSPGLPFCLLVILIIPEEGTVTISIHMQTEIRMESCSYGLRRIVPFRDHGCIRVIPVQHLPHFSPYGNRPGLIFIITLYKRIGHIDSESVTAMIQPEPHHILHGFPGGNAVRMIHRKLPLFCRMKEPVVQRRLTFEKVQDITSIALAFSCHERHVIRSVETGICPDIAIAERICFRLFAFFKPWMFL